MKASCGINYSSSSREMVTLLVCGLNEQFDFNCTERRYRLWARKPDICSPVKKKQQQQKSTLKQFTVCRIEPDVLFTRKSSFTCPFLFFLFNLAQKKKNQPFSTRNYFSISSSNYRVTFWGSFKLDIFKPVIFHPCGVLPRSFSTTDIC